VIKTIEEIVDAENYLRFAITEADRFEYFDGERGDKYLKDLIECAAAYVDNIPG